MKRTDFVLTLGQRLLLLFFIFIVCFAITAVAATLISHLLKTNVAAALRISTTIQDVLTFVVPAVATAIIVTRKPAELLCLQRRINLTTIFCILAMLVVSIPIQENIIYWNANITLPESLDAFVKFARTLEDEAFRSMCMLLNNSSAATLVVNILIIGIAAGFSEEILFRGCFQRLLTTGGVNTHVAIWTVAFVFSAMHGQFFGFVPRMLLGAYFGYLLIWTQSLWAPVLAHVLNNTVFVIGAWLQVRQGNPIDDTPTLYPISLAIISTVLVVILLTLLYKKRHTAITENR